MPLTLGATFPNFTKPTSDGDLTFYDYMGDSWCILCSHPDDFTPVCTTELGHLTKIMPEFERRNVKVIALSCNTTESHKAWIPDVQKVAGTEGPFPYPIIADTDRDLATQLGMLDPEEKDAKGAPMTCRAVFIISPDKKLKLSILYPASTGRNFDEVLRVIDSLQLTAYKKVATPVNWKHGDECMVVPSVKQEDVAGLFPKGHRIEEVPSGKAYLRFTPDPSA
eukprot:m.141874 g.141874  ORF g.141874 m.141874 type:complete len:223 (+) comp22889_c0_seq1:306-974(+)